MAVYQRTFQPFFPFVGLSLQDVQGQLHHQVSPGGIQVGSRKNPVDDILQPGIGQGVHAEKRNVRGLSQGPAGTQGHPVVLAEDGIRPDALFLQFQHSLIAVFLQPVAVGGGQQLHPGML